MTETALAALGISFGVANLLGVGIDDFTDENSILVGNSLEMSLKLTDCVVKVAFGKILVKEMSDGYPFFRLVVLSFGELNIRYERAADLRDLF